ncbi:MAG TPA: ABC transporter substrate-binding protein [Gaiellaceae bacterium]|nr:ABC transporter substrate-binding protein [Gaiellaceae bacterium]
MRRARFGIVAVLAVAAAVVATIGVTTAAGKGSAAKPIIIGAAIDTSGQMSPFNNPALTAAQLEIAKINAAGGVNGRKLRMLTCNTQNSKPDVSTSCASSLISKGAVIGWVTCDVDFATPAILTFLNKGLLTVAPCIGTDQMGPKRFGKKGKLAFSFGNAAQDEGAAMAEYAYKVKKWTTAITVTDNVIVYFKNVVQAFTDRFKQLGGSIVDAESFTSGDKTIQNVVSRVNQHKADVIVTSDGFADWPTEVAGIRSLGNNTPIMNSWAGDGTFWYPKSPKVTNYYYVTYASVFGDDPSAPVKALIAKMTGNKKPATGGFVTGAAAIDGIVAAIKRSGGSTNGAKLAAAMEKFRNVPTISGGVSFSPALHSVFGRTYRVMEVNDNTPKYVGQVKASSPAKIS